MLILSSTVPLITKKKRDTKRRKKGGRTGFFQWQIMTSEDKLTFNRTFKKIRFEICVRDERREVYTLLLILYSIIVSRLFLNCCSFNV